jgi:hypothetical protein
MGGSGAWVDEGDEGRTVFLEPGLAEPLDLAQVGEGSGAAAGDFGEQVVGEDGVDRHPFGVGERFALVPQAGIQGEILRGEYFLPVDFASGAGLQAGFGGMDDKDQSGPTRVGHQMLLHRHHAVGGEAGVQIGQVRRPGDRVLEEVVAHGIRFAALV